MADIIDFKSRKKVKEDITNEKSEEIVQMVFEDSFDGMIELITELGYSISDDKQTIQDISAFAYLSAGVVARKLGVAHSSHGILDLANKLIETSMQNPDIKADVVSVIIEKDTEDNDA